VPGASFRAVSPRRAGSFFESFQLGRVLPDVARASRDVAEPQSPDQLTDCALVIIHLPPLQDQLPQIPAAPAHHPVALPIGASLDQRGQRHFLLGTQLPSRARCLAVDQPGRSFGIEPVHPIAQRLPVHHANPCRLGPALALVHRRERQ